MADPTPSTWDTVVGAVQGVPAHVQRLINALKSTSLPTTKANPNDPNDPTGKGGAASKATMDKMIQDAGG